jgi:hypothetical protein
VGCSVTFNGRLFLKQGRIDGGDNFSILTVALERMITATAEKVPGPLICSAINHFGPGAFLMPLAAACPSSKTPCR